MDKEDVLKLEYVKINEDYTAVYISYQNEDVLPRGKFEDKELKVYSEDRFGFEYMPWADALYIRNEAKFDFLPIIVGGHNELILKIKEKVKKINEKYGIPIEWKPEVGERFYFIYFDDFTIENTVMFPEIDQPKLDAGNCFKTEELAKETLEKIKDLLKRGDDIDRKRTREKNIKTS